MASVGEYLRPDVIQQVERLDLRARFIVEGFYSGLHDSPYHGFSVEFSEHRRYHPGDDLRSIDWNVFAKTDRFFVKQYRAETNVSAHLLVDVSASMNYPSPADLDLLGDKPRMRKIDYAICLAAAMGYMMIHQQDAVGLITFDDRVRAQLPPKTSRSHLTNLLGILARTEPTGRTSLPEVLHDVADRVRKRGLVVIFSDLLAEPDEVIDAWKHIRYRRHDLIVFQVLDVAEVTFPFAGQVRFDDPESDAYIDTTPRAIRAAYLDKLAETTERYRKAASDMRADFMQVHTGMTFDKALIEYLLRRQAKF